MNSYDFDSWTAQTPPDSFAERAVAAMLELDTLPAKRKLRLPKLGWLALAAILCGSAAWAALSQGHATLEPTPPADTPVAPLPEPSGILFASEGAPAIPQAAADPPPKPVYRAKPRATTPASAEPAPSASSPRYIIVPRCVCTPDIMCSCVNP